MNTTTPGALRDTFITQIHGITPSHTDYTTATWRHVNRLGEVPGSLRNYHVAFSTAEEVDEGFYGGGIQMKFFARVWTYYGDLHPGEDDSIITEDGRQIWLTLRGVAESSNDGFVNLIPQGWEDETEEEGHRFGAHVYEVHYLAADSA